MTDEGARHSRGLVLLTVGNGVFIVSGYAITVWLAHHFGPSRYGAYGVVVALVTVLNIVVARGVPVVAQRRVAADGAGTADGTRTADGAGMADETGAAAGRVVRDAARALAVPALVAGALLAALAVPLAGAFGDDRLQVPLAIGALAAISYAAQALALTVPTALQQYRRQATAQVAYAIGRVALIIGGAAAWGLDGAIAGFVAAPLIGALAAWVTPSNVGSADDPTHPHPFTPSNVGSASREQAASTRRTYEGAGPTQVIGASELRTFEGVNGAGWLRAAVPLIATAAFVTLLLSLDLLGVQVGGGAHDAGLYAAAATIAHVPFFLLQSAGLVLLPGVARAVTPQARMALVRRGLTDTVVLLTFATIQVALLGTAIAEALFGARFADSAPLVAPIALATWGITMHAACAAIDSGLARLRETVLLGGLACATMFLAAWAARAHGSLPDAAGAVAAVCLLLGIAHLGVVARRAELRGAGALFSRRAVTGLLLLNVPFAFIAWLGVVAHNQTGATWPLLVAGLISSVAYLWSASRLGLLGIGVRNSAAA